MKRFTIMMWAAVAVLGLYSPVASYASGPFGSSLRGRPSGGSNGGSMKSTPSTGFGATKIQAMNPGGMSSQVLRSPSTANSNHTLGKRKLPGAGSQAGPFADISKSAGNAVGKVDANAGHTLGKRKLPAKTSSSGSFMDLSKLAEKAVGKIDPNAGRTLGKRKLPSNGSLIDVVNAGKGIDPNAGHTLGKRKLPSKIPSSDAAEIGKKLDPNAGHTLGKRKLPKKVPEAPNPGNGAKPPKPPIDPGNGAGGGKPPGGSIPPGGGNGGGNGTGGGHGHGHGHGHHQPHWWPNYCLDWYCPTYYPPYCGTVFVNGSWTYVTQPVAVDQISLVDVRQALPEIPSAATFKMQVFGLGATEGMAAVEVNGVGMQAEVLEWNGDSVVVRLPSVGLTQPLISDLYILQSDGSMAKTLKFKMLPALQNAVAAN